MPNRIIKESICYSDDLDKLTPFEETVFYRLLVRVDDYGRIDARPGFLKSMLFATKKGITEKNIEDAVNKLASVGLVQVYEVTGKPFLLLPKWGLHQRLRNSREKYPPPTENGLRQLAATCGDSRPESESQSESQSQSQSQSQSEISLAGLPGGESECACEDEPDKQPPQKRNILELFGRTYAEYPRKEGKAKALQHYRAYLTGGKTVSGVNYRFNHEQIYIAVLAYADECEGREPRYIKHFDAFLAAPLVDYVERTAEDYENLMSETRGGDWRKVRYVYE